MVLTIVHSSAREVDYYTVAVKLRTSEPSPKSNAKFGFDLTSRTLATGSKPKTKHSLFIVHLVLFGGSLDPTALPFNFSCSLLQINCKMYRLRGSTRRLAALVLLLLGVIMSHLVLELEPDANEPSALQQRLTQNLLRANHTSSRKKYSYWKIWTGSSGSSGKHGEGNSLVVPSISDNDDDTSNDEEDPFPPPLYGYASIKELQGRAAASPQFRSAFKCTCPIGICLLVHRLWHKERRFHLPWRRRRWPHSLPIRQSG